MRPHYRGFAPSRTDESLSTLPFSYATDDGSIDALSGQVGTFARSSGGGYAIDGLGLMRTLPRGMPRFEAALDPVSGQRRLGLRIEPAHTNLILHSDDLSQWSQQGTADIVGSKQLGDLVFQLLLDNDAGVGEGRNRTITFTGNAEKVWSVPIGGAGSGTFRILIVDTTAPADRMHAIITWASGVPQVTMNVGQFLGMEPLADDDQGNVNWILHFKTTTVTAGNTNVVSVVPAGPVAAATGSTWFNGGWAYDYPAPLGGVRSGAASGVVNGESLTWPLALPRAGRRWWMYLAFWELGGRYKVDANSGLAAVGTVTDCGLGFFPSGTGHRAFHCSQGLTGGEASHVTVAGYPSVLRTYTELLVTTDALGRPSLTVAYDGVALGTVAGANAPFNLTEDWTDSVVRLGAFGASASHAHGGMLYHRLKLGEIGYLGVPAIARVRGWR